MTNLQEIANIDTEKTQDYNDLFNKRLASKLTQKSNEGMNILSDEENPVPFEEINTYLRSNPKLGVHFDNDDQRKIVEANVLNERNERILNIYMTPDKDSLLNVISQSTYDTLVSDAVIDPIDAFEEVKGQLENAI